jgi:hypothetical protein
MSVGGRGRTLRRSPIRSSNLPARRASRAWFSSHHSEWSSPPSPPTPVDARLSTRSPASELEWTILRPTGFAQNFSEGFLLPGILQADTMFTASGDGAVAFVDAADIAALAAAALTDAHHAGAIYALTGSQPSPSRRPPRS